MKRSLLLIAAAISCAFYSTAQPCGASNTWLGITNDWFAPSNWCTGMIPVSTTDVTISPGTANQPVINAPGALCHSINILSGASLTINGSNILSVAGDWTNNGTFNANNSTVSFTANTAVTQTLTGNTIFYNISKPNASSTLSFGSSTTTIGNNLSVSGGSMNGGTSTIVFTGNASSLQGNSTKDFYNLEISGSAVLTQTAGTNINVNNSYKNNGTFIQSNARTITFQTISQTLSGSGVSTFGNLTVSGAVTLNAGTHDFSLLGTLNLPSAPGVFNGGSAKITFAGSTAALGAGPGIINFNNITITGTLSNPANKNFNVTASWLNNGSYNAGNETITFNGGSQTIGGSSSTAFNNLTISGTADKTLGNDITVNNTLLLANRNIDANSNAKTVYAKGAVTRSSTGHIIGNLKKDIPAGSNNTKLFEVGTSVYAPVIINFSMTNGGLLTVRTDDGDDPNIGTSTLDAGKSVNRHWIVTGNGIDPGNYDATFEFVGDDVDAGVNPNSLKIGKYSAGTWIYPGATNLDPTHIKATGLDGFGDFAIAEAACTLPSISNQPLASQSICQSGTSMDLALIADGDGLSFQWYVDDDNTGFDGIPVGSSGSSFTPPANIAGTFHYYCMVTGACGTAVSHYATVSVNPQLTWYRDADGDGFGDASNPTQACTLPAGYVSDNTDCDDDDNTIYPDATEICDGKDNDCNGVIDQDVKTTFYRDSDDDGFGDASNPTQACTVPAGYVSDNSDCDDDDNTVYPGAADVCDGKDNDCNGVIDQDGKAMFYRDADGDGFGDASNSIQACTAPTGYVINNADCNDDDNTVHPDATEICDGKDNDCNGVIDQDVKAMFYRDADGDGFGDASNSIQACTAPTGYVINNADCNDDDNTVHPDATEICDGKDDNCDGQVDEGFDTDGDGHTICEGDCNDHDASIYPGAQEICDDKDNNCNGQTDEGVKTTFYRDADADGYGNESSPVEACSAPPGYVGINGDCNDGDAVIHPNATETCDGKDNNCDALVDNNIQSVTWYYDTDGDGYGVSDNPIQSCSQPAGYAAINGDCNDHDPSIHPGAPDICDGKDNNCNGETDENATTTYYRDADSDGYGNPSLSINGCIAPQGYVSNNSDCNDNKSSIHPGAKEICGNGIDENCNGQSDDGCITTVKVCAYSQTAYNKNNIICVPTGVSSAGQIMLAAVDGQPGDSVIFGSKASGRFFTLKKSDIQSGYIYKLLPGNGAPKALKGYATYTRPATWTNVPLTAGGAIQNELLAHTMVLFFNLQLSQQFGSLPLNTNLSVRKLTLCVVQGNLIQLRFTVKSSVANCLQAKYGSPGITIGNLYKLANELLGNTNTCNLSYADVNDAVKNINESFNGCVLVNIPGSVNNNSQTITTGLPETSMKDANVATELSKLTVSTSPNPFHNNVRFNIVSPETGKLRILLYDASGIKRGELEQDVIKNIPATIWFRNQQLRLGVLFYRVSINDKTSTGKIMQVN